MKKKTKYIHGGISRDPYTGAVSTPIYQVSTFKHEGVGNFKYEYSRTGNPTRESLEKLIADMENGSHGFAFGSGMAAITAVLQLFSAGDHIVATDDIYGGTFRLLTDIFNRYDITATFVDTSDTSAVSAAIKSNTKAIYVETPTNPLLKVTDIAAMGDISKKNHLRLIVDNTFSTPYWQNPLDLGADLVLHSATKYIGGHSDVVAGLVVVNDENLAAEVHFVQNAAGGILGPQDSWLLIRGIKTLALRMEAIEKNTLAVAQFLKQHPQVEKVYYPGLDMDSGHKVQTKQADGFGGMVSFVVSDQEKALSVLNKLNYFILAESLGGVESLICLPAQMTHAAVPRERRLALGIADGLIRVSVGIEDQDDLIGDLKQALESQV